MGEEVKKISVFDFDQTLVNTPQPEEAKKIWKEVTGQDWPHLGYWGRKESLNTDVFDFETIPSTYQAYQKEKTRNDTLLVMMTGRHSGIGDLVEKILNERGFEFDKYLYKKSNPTFMDKIGKLNHMVRKNPGVEVIEMWEDREEHVKGFREWGEGFNDIEVVVNHVKS